MDQLRGGGCSAAPRGYGSALGVALARPRRGLRTTGRCPALAFTLAAPGGGAVAAARAVHSGGSKSGKTYRDAPPKKIMFVATGTETGTIVMTQNKSGTNGRSASARPTNRYLAAPLTDRWPSCLIC